MGFQETNRMEGELYRKNLRHEPIEQIDATKMTFTKFPG